MMGPKTSVTISLGIALSSTVGLRLEQAASHAQPTDLLGIALSSTVGLRPTSYAVRSAEGVLSPSSPNKLRPSVSPPVGATRQHWRPGPDRTRCSITQSPATRATKPP